MAKETSINAAISLAEHAGESRVRTGVLGQHARFLLHRLDLDPERVEALAGAVREGRSIPGNDDAGCLSDLLGMATATLQVCDHSRLREELDAEFTYTDPAPQGLFHPHRRLRRALRRLNPAWWVRRMAVRRRARFVHSGPSPYGGSQQIAVHIDGDQVVGALHFAICHACRRGHVYSIWIEPAVKSCGLGTRALMQARRRAPGYQWHTSEQFETARTYWQYLARRTADTYTPAEPCRHLTDDRGDPPPRDLDGDPDTGRADGPGPADPPRGATAAGDASP